MLAYFESQYSGRAQVGNLADADYELLRCRQCSLAYQRAVPGEHLLGSIYDHWIPASERARLEAARTLADSRYLAAQVDFLVRHLGLPPSQIETLDFGLGWGEWGRMALGYGCRVDGIELSSERKAHAWSIGIPIVELRALARDHYHFIRAEQVFEHLVDPADMLRQLKTALRPGGLINLSVPDARRALKQLTSAKSITALAQVDLMALAPLEHINSFEHRSLVALAAACGLRLVRPSLRLQYSAASGWLDPRHAAKTFARGVYRFIWPGSTFLYFTHA